MDKTIKIYQKRNFLPVWLWKNFLTLFFGIVQYNRIKIIAFCFPFIRYMIPYLKFISYFIVSIKRVLIEINIFNRVCYPYAFISNENIFPFRTKKIIGNSYKYNKKKIKNEFFHKIRLEFLYLIRVLIWRFLGLVKNRSPITPIYNIFLTNCQVSEGGN